MHRKFLLETFTCRIYYNYNYNYLYDLSFMVCPKMLAADIGNDQNSEGVFWKFFAEGGIPKIPPHPPCSRCLLLVLSFLCRYFIYCRREENFANSSLETIKLSFQGQNYNKVMKKCFEYLRDVVNKFFNLLYHGILLYRKFCDFV